MVIVLFCPWKLNFLRMTRSQFSIVFVFFLLFLTSANFLGSTHASTGDDFEHDGEADVEVEDNVDSLENQVDNTIEYTSPVLETEPGSVYLAEDFDDPDKVRGRWQVSKAKKEGSTTPEAARYDGVWDYGLPQRPIFQNDRSLILKTKAKHAAISAKLKTPFYFKTKPLFVQYEVTFQNGMDCGGAYIKLLSHSSGLDLTKFTDKTPYTIMFGPDKCGNDYKLHFIFRHKNPINGTFEEKHAKKPSSRLEEVYTDKKPHLYLLKLFPDNTFQVYVDGSLVNSGSLLSDMSPPINPPMEIPDADDKKPFDWDERETIPDETAKKPDDWDDEAPAKIPDPSATAPSGWLVDEKPMLPDTKAQKPSDWDESMDGEWEPPLVTNPACESAPGCGEWTAPLIDNPNFRGKWKQPMIPNPNYKGKWSPRMIPNPDYFEDPEPFKMTPIGALGIEIWTMTDLVLFDNFIITDSEAILAEWTRQTFDLKKKAIDKDSEGVITRTLNYTNAHPWLWAVYVVVIGLPVVLIITFCCGSSQDKKQAESNKKTDDYVEDDADAAQGPQESEVYASVRRVDKRSKTIGGKKDFADEDKEADVGGGGDGGVGTIEVDNTPAPSAMELNEDDDDEEDPDFVYDGEDPTEAGPSAIVEGIKKRRPRLEK